MTATVASPVVPVSGNEDLGPLITLATQGAGTTNSNVVSTPNDVRGVKLVVDITAVGGTPTLTVTLRGRDRASQKTFTLLASAALSAVATTVLTVYPGLTAAANTVANDHIVEQWDVTAVIAGTTPSITATISAHLLY